MRRRMKLSMLVIILLLAVGFAAVSTTLIINGTAKFRTNDADFEVIFTSASLDGVDVSATTISEDGKTLTYETNELAKVGDKSVLDFEVTNNSTQYDANIVMECIAEGSNSEYYTITNTIPSVIESKSKVSGSVTATLKKVSTEEITETFTCTITANAVERTEAGVGDGSVTPEDSTYSLYGYLTDENGDAIANENLVVYSETPHYVTTDNNGYFYVEGLEKGSHEIYYVGTTDATSMTKEEVVNSALDKAEITTTSNEIVFDSGIKVENSTIEVTNNKTYEITFDTDGGSSLSNMSVTQNKAYGDLPIPEKEGYTFENWQTEDGVVITSTSLVTKSETHTLKAIWVGEAVAINFDANGGNEITMMLSKQYGGTYGNLPTATRTGYTFNGWYTEATGGTKVESITTIDFLGSKTLYAQWTAITYNITYVGTIGEYAPTSAKYDEIIRISNPTKSITITFDGNETGIIDNTSIKEDLVFNGWQAPNSSETIDTTTAMYGTTSDNVSTNWASQYTAVKGEYFKNLQSEAGKSVMLTMSWTPTKITPSQLSKAGYTCSWNNKADGSGTKYYSGQEYSIYNDLTLYAICDKNVKVVSGTGSAVGDVIAIGSEKFNVMSNDGTNIKMFAQYNLSADYKQTSTSTRKSFSNAKGWTANSDIDIQQYDGEAKTYVNEYVSYLQGLADNNSISGTLITISELRKLGCTGPVTNSSMTNYNYYICENSTYESWLINGQTTWTRTATSDTASTPWNFREDGRVHDYQNNGFGIRPVITIPASLIE